MIKTFLSGFSNIEQFESDSHGSLTVGALNQMLNAMPEPHEKFFVSLDPEAPEFFQISIENSKILVEAIAYADRIRRFAAEDSGLGVSFGAFDGIEQFGPIRADVFFERPVSAELINRLAESLFPGEELFIFTESDRPLKAKSTTTTQIWPRSKP